MAEEPALLSVAAVEVEAYGRFFRAGRDNPTNCSP